MLKVDHVTSDLLDPQKPPYGLSAPPSGLERPRESWETQTGRLNELSGPRHGFINHLNLICAKSRLFSFVEPHVTGESFCGSADVPEWDSDGSDGSHF